MTGADDPIADVERPASRWLVSTAPTAADVAIAAACDISPVSAAILRERGYTTRESICGFFHPSRSHLRDPLLLPDIDATIERLYRAITSQEPLLVFGDYDVDGVTSTALLVRSLRALGGNIDYAVPERADGYGLSVSVVENAHEKGITLILTADCGITAHEPVQKAKELGIDVIITDHHEPLPDMPLSDALAVVKPKRSDSGYGFRELCGCAVAFKVIQALVQRYWPHYSEKYWDRFIELVGLASVADCVPLIDENRYLVREGLRCLASTRKQGLKALLRSSGTKLSVNTEGEALLSGRSVGFRLAPRLNAAGRIASPRLALELLLSGDADICTALATEIEEHNRVRQEQTLRVVKEASVIVEQEVKLEHDPLIVIAGEGWEHGVIGLAATRLVERYARPVILLGIERGECGKEGDMAAGEAIAKGSGRSVDGFDLGEVLHVTRHLLTSGGGHAGACGLALPVSALPEFRTLALQHAREKLQINELVPVIKADCAVIGRDITPQLVRELSQFEPCGAGNAEALLMFSGVRIIDGRAMGPDGRDLKWRIDADGQCFEAVWFYPDATAHAVGIGHLVDICFTPQFNSFRGRNSLQLVVKAARMHHRIR